ncbi:MAG TPA: YceI family protein [Solirubrobacterales bacterium]|jgi:polyisoprenoid-binding protein YceI|nr:YceI family protein [Solirubrobacterales bacterium]
MSTVIEQGLPSGTFAADPLHSTIGFSVDHLGVAVFRNRFRAYEATLHGGAAPSLTGSVEVSSIDVDDEQLKGHLMSPEFFDAERYPQLRFSSRELILGEDGSARLRGELEIRGQVHEIEASGSFRLPTTDLYGNSRAGLRLEASLDRRKFGLDWQAELPSGGEALGYEVKVEADLEFIAQEA